MLKEKSKEELKQELVDLENETIFLAFKEMIKENDKAKKILESMKITGKEVD
jgi:ribosomal protein L29